MNTESLNEIPHIAIVLISCKQKSIEGIIRQLNEIGVVKETMLVEGQWNILVKLESFNLDHIRDAIRWNLRNIDGIETTLTLVESES